LSHNTTTHDVNHPRTTHPLLERLARTNRTAVFLATLALLLGSLLAPKPFGGLLLLTLVLALAAVAATTWPVQSGRTRALRVVVLALLAAAALFHIF
jgi:hypothetical protein